MELLNLKMELNTDHKGIVILLDHQEWTNRQFIAWKKNANQRHKHKIWNMSEISNEQWNKFKYMTNTPIENIDHFLNNNNLDQLWNLIRSKTIDTPNKCFPKVKEPKNKTMRHNFIKYKPIAILINLVE